MCYNLYSIVSLNKILMRKKLYLLTYLPFLNVSFQHLREGEEEKKKGKTELNETEQWKKSIRQKR